MSRCLSCNNILDDEEETFSYEWGETIDLCIECLEETELYDSDQVWGQDI